ncbi:MAG: enoyl-CoA hydratase-related protein [Bacteroidales bacterium]|nr:enoyl-CoA hydratase-related protein [Bacteroidales bacterium]
MEYNHLLVDNSHPQICLLTISAPKSLNALNLDILKELNTFIDHLDKTVRVLIITGDGPKSFVAGADIAQMQGFSEAESLEFSRFGAGVFKKLEDLEIPVIAAINGFALGGGCELALACDIRIASENAVFGQPEVKLGIIPGFSGTYRLSKIVGQGLAKELIYTGNNIKANEALRVGLVNTVVPQPELIDYCLKVATDILHAAPIAVKYAKKSINENYDLSAKEAIELENQYFSKCFSTKDQKEGMSAFLEKRKALYINE